MSTLDNGKMSPGSLWKLLSIKMILHGLNRHLKFFTSTTSSMSLHSAFSGERKKKKKRHRNINQLAMQIEQVLCIITMPSLA